MKKPIYMLILTIPLVIANMVNLVEADEGERFLDIGEGQKVRIIEDRISDSDALRVIQYCKYLIERKGSMDTIDDLLDKVIEFNSNANIIAEAWYCKLQKIYQLSGFMPKYFFEAISKLVNLYPNSEVMKKDGRLARTLENILKDMLAEKQISFWHVTGVYQIYKDLTTRDNCSQLLDQKILDRDLSETSEYAFIRIKEWGGDLIIKFVAFDFSAISQMYDSFEGFYGRFDYDQQWSKDLQKNWEGFYGSRVNDFINNYVNFDQSKLEDRTGRLTTNGRWFTYKKGITLRKIIKEFYPCLSGYEYSWLKKNSPKSRIFE